MAQDIDPRRWSPWQRKRRQRQSAPLRPERPRIGAMLAAVFSGFATLLLPALAAAACLPIAQGPGGDLFRFASAPAATAPAAPAAKPEPNSIGSPTHVEASADGATLLRATSTVIFDGNVKGFYRLKGADGKAQDFNFAGSKATFRFNAEAKGGQLGGLSVDVIGEPVSIQVPALNLGL